jgi:hypothetical protein
MTPTSHKDSAAVEASAGSTRTAGTLAFDPVRALAFALQSSDAAWAMAAFTANQTLAGQITFVHLVGRLAREQSRSIEQAGRTVLPEGAAREAAGTLARLGDQWADSVIDAANHVGRSFGHLAFAFAAPYRRT